MVGAILYFLHRHVRVATPVAIVLLMALAAVVASSLHHLMTSSAR